MRSFFSLYRLNIAKTYIYMLQQVDYNVQYFLKWFKRVFANNKSFSDIKKRSELTKTVKVKVLLMAQYLSLFTLVCLLFYFCSSKISILLFSLLFLILLMPYILLISLLSTVLLLQFFVLGRYQKNNNIETKKLFNESNAIKIAIIGSYGKTTIKEALKTLLSEKLKVKATPGNMNVLSSHNKFAKELNGEEDVIIVEFGEGEPGDIEKMSDVLKPDYAVITGLAPNHLDKYGSLIAVAEDFASIKKYVKKDKLFYYDNAKLLRPLLGGSAQAITTSTVYGWEITDVIISVLSTKFKMTKDNMNMDITTGLLGRHQVGAIAFCAALAHKLGLRIDEIESGCKKIMPFEHRMQPRNLHGAWLLDDTYNGNIEGLKAGLQLLSELDMKRKWYVTPGLVEQGMETESVHIQLGEAIAKAKPDIVILMENSVRSIIEQSLMDSGYSGELRIEKDPLNFYTNIEHLLASGDLVLMQNDWTDNYN